MVWECTLGGGRGWRKPVGVGRLLGIDSKVNPYFSIPLIPLRKHKKRLYVTCMSPGLGPITSRESLEPYRRERLGSPRSRRSGGPFPVQEAGAALLNRAGVEALLAVQVAEVA